MRLVRSYPVILISALASSFLVGACSSAEPSDEALEPSELDSLVQEQGDEANLETASSPLAAILPGVSRGSAIALSPDDTTLVVANRDVGSVSVFAVAYPPGAPPTATKIKEISLGAGSEPWQVVIAPDSSAAFVVLRKDQKLVKIGWLKTAPGKAGEVVVGAEPTGLALTPTGALAYVANWVDGTLTVVDTKTLQVKTTVDLNATLVGTGLLGQVGARAALAHPRSLVITNDGDGDDSDESVYVTEYYAQRIEAEENNGARKGLNADTSKAGIVYKVRVGAGNASAIRLAPLWDMGFKDENNQAAGCYPNQLQSVTVQGKFAYVLSICASPKGPIGPKVTTTSCAAVTDCSALNLVDPACVPLAAGAANNVCVDLAGVKTTTAPVVSVIDTTTDREVSRSNLNAQFRDFYVRNNVPDDASRRYPLVANDIDFVPGTTIAYVTASGADAVFRVRFDGASGAITEVGASTNRFIDLAPAALANDKKGFSPTGLGVQRGKAFAWAASDVGRNITAVDLNVQAIAGGVAAAAVFPATAQPAPGSDAEAVVRGRRFFNTGLARWSLKGQGWGACQSCHQDGLTDNVTWYFARGPRQSVSLDGSFSSKNAADQRIFNWTGIFDGVADFENNTRGVSGGVGAIVRAAALGNENRIDLANAGGTGQNHNGLNGSAEDLADVRNPLGLPAGQQSVLKDWAEITRYVQTIRSPRKPTRLDANKVAAGRTLFQQKNCQGCHGGDKWTISSLFYKPSVATNNALKTSSWANLVADSGFPTSLLPATTPGRQLMRFDGGNAAALDQIQCILRPVGTFGVAEAAVAQNGAFPEVRANMVAIAQGDETDGRGYNPPSLLGMSTGAPYLHAGNARTLEAAFSAIFQSHHQSLATNFLDPSDSGAVVERDNLIAFLLSIDEHATPIAAPSRIGPTGGSFCAAP